MTDELRGLATRLADMVESIASASTRSGREISNPDALTCEQVERIARAIGADGHTIYPVEDFAHKADVPTELLEVAGLVRTYKSGDGPKSTITRGFSGERVEEMRGVYSLDVLRTLAGMTGYHSDKFGRGSEAEDCYRHLLALLEQHPPAHPGALFQPYARDRAEAGTTPKH